MAGASSGSCPWPYGMVLRLYLSRMVSPGRLRVQNLQVWSLDPEQRMCPTGCQSRLQMLDSWAFSMAPTSFSAPTDQNIMAPSDPPLANSSSWTGCQARVSASRLCPRKVCSSSFKLRMSKIFSKWSRDAVNNQFPFLFHLQCKT